MGQYKWIEPNKTKEPWIVVQKYQLKLLLLPSLVMLERCSRTTAADWVNVNEIQNKKVGKGLSAFVPFSEPDDRYIFNGGQKKTKPINNLITYDFFGLGIEPQS